MPGNTPTISYAGAADEDSSSRTLNNNTPIIFHDGSYLTAHDGNRIIFHDPYGRPGRSLETSVPRTDFTGEADL